MGRLIEFDFACNLNMNFGSLFNQLGVSAQARIEFEYLCMTINMEYPEIDVDDLAAKAESGNLSMTAAEFVYTAARVTQIMDMRLRVLRSPLIIWVLDGSILGIEEVSLDQADAAIKYGLAQGSDIIRVIGE